MPPALLFDLDGTLVDSRADLALAVNLTRADLGLPPLPPAAVAGMVGDGVRALLTRALPECPDRLEEALALNARHYAAHLLDGTRAYPGVPEALAALAAAGHPMAVVTNKPGPFAAAILAGLGLDRCFGALVGGGDAPALKPDPAPLRQALAALGASPEGAWMVGDHHTDLRAGHRAGLRTCFCRFGIGEPGDQAYTTAVDRASEWPAVLRIL